MRTISMLAVSVVVVGGLGSAAYRPAMNYWAAHNRTLWRTAKVEKGNVVAVVNSTGTVKPKIEVSVGSFISGPILELFCEFNQEVKKGDLLAKIDPRLYQAAVAHDRATLAMQQADVLRVQSQLQQAINDEKRATVLRDRGDSIITQADFDKYKFSRMSLEAQLQISARPSTRPRRRWRPPWRISTMPRSARPSTASSSIVKSTRVRRSPPNSRHRNCSSSRPICGRRCTSTLRSTKPTSDSSNRPSERNIR